MEEVAGRTRWRCMGRQSYALSKSVEGCSREGGGPGRAREAAEVFLLALEDLCVSGRAFSG